MCVVGIGELVVGLLLHVVGNDTFVGYRGPKVLVLVHIHHIRLTHDAHAGIYLFQVALETLCLGVVYAEAGGSLYPQVAIEHLLQADDIAVRQRRAVLRVALEVLEGVAVKPVQTGRRTKPHEAALVFQDAVDLTAYQAVSCIQGFKQINSCSCHGQCQHED